MKGIVLAGGAGSRLWPVTKVVSKQLLPLYDKPMIYYPLSILLMAHIREILIISTPTDLPRFEDLLGNGENIGVSLLYAIQPRPEGLAQSFIIGKEFIGHDSTCLILGDNVFYGAGLNELLKNAVNIVNNEKKAVVFGYYVNNPEQYGVAEFDNEGNVVSIEEKPKNPKSHYAVVGLYFYPNEVVKIAQKIKPSARGELEITSVNEEFRKQQRLKLEMMGRGYAWLDTGTNETMTEATNFVQTIEKRQGLKIACIEEIAWRNHFIDDIQLSRVADSLKNSQYGQYLHNLLEKL
ncbi:MAG: glucose-1-phosphate thymidylyltransferase RfbA [Candidatus Aminicenantes bacterium]|nr:glucose-1-phosphate thymidylyltransferase RfbA [Candidatus Aminicenantes bacterium]